MLADAPSLAQTSATTFLNFSIRKICIVTSVMSFSLSYCDCEQGEIQVTNTKNTQNNTIFVVEFEWFSNCAFLMQIFFCGRICSVDFPFTKSTQSACLAVNDPVTHGDSFFCKSCLVERPRIQITSGRGDRL